MAFKRKYTRADSDLDVSTVVEKLELYLECKNSRDLWSLTAAIKNIRNSTSSFDPADLAGVSDLFVALLEIAPSGKISSLILKTALHKMNNTVKEPQGILKINFTNLDDEYFVEKLDERVRCGFSAFRKIKRRKDVKAASSYYFTLCILFHYVFMQLYFC